jgi:hypothetical protein
VRWPTQDYLPYRDRTVTVPGWHSMTGGHDWWAVVISLSASQSTSAVSANSVR